MALLLPSHTCSIVSSLYARIHHRPACLKADTRSSLVACQDDHKFKRPYYRLNSRSKFSRVLRFSFGGGSDDVSTSPSEQRKAEFGYSRKDVLLIGLGVTAIGFALKYGLEFFGVDSLQAGNVVQLVMVLGLTVGWISTYIFRVSTKDMTYAQQLRDYESKVMQKRLEGLTEGELEALLTEVDEEKQRRTKS